MLPHYHTRSFTRESGIEPGQSEIEQAIDQLVAGLPTPSASVPDFSIEFTYGVRDNPVYTNTSPTVQSREIETKPTFESTPIPFQGFTVAGPVSQDTVQSSGVDNSSYFYSDTVDMATINMSELAVALTSVSKATYPGTKGDKYLTFKQQIHDDTNSAGIGKPPLSTQQRLNIVLSRVLKGSLYHRAHIWVVKQLAPDMLAVTKGDDPDVKTTVNVSNAPWNEDGEMDNEDEDFESDPLFSTQLPLISSIKEVVTTTPKYYQDALGNIMTGAEVIMKKYWLAMDEMFMSADPADIVKFTKMKQQPGETLENWALRVQLCYITVKKYAGITTEAAMRVFLRGLSSRDMARVVEQDVKGRSSETYNVELALAYSRKYEAWAKKEKQLDVISGNVDAADSGTSSEERAKTPVQTSASGDVKAFVKGMDEKQKMTLLRSLTAPKEKCILHPKQNHTNEECYKQHPELLNNRDHNNQRQRSGQERQHTVGATSSGMSHASTAGYSAGHYPAPSSIGGGSSHTVATGYTGYTGLSGHTYPRQSQNYYYTAAATPQQGSVHAPTRWWCDLCCCHHMGPCRCREPDKAPADWRPAADRVPQAAIDEWYAKRRQLGLPNITHHLVTPQRPPPPPPGAGRGGGRYGNNNSTSSGNNTKQPAPPNRSALSVEMRDPGADNFYCGAMQTEYEVANTRQLRSFVQRSAQPSPQTPVADSIPVLDRDITVSFRLPRDKAILAQLLGDQPPQVSASAVGTGVSEEQLGKAMLQEYNSEVACLYKIINNSVSTGLSVIRSDGIPVLPQDVLVDSGSDAAVITKAALHSLGLHYISDPALKLKGVSGYAGTVLGRTAPLQVYFCHGTKYSASIPVQFLVVESLHGLADVILGVHQFKPFGCYTDPIDKRMYYRYRWQSHADVDTKHYLPVRTAIKPTLSTALASQQQDFLCASASVVQEQGGAVTLEAGVQTEVSIDVPVRRSKARRVVMQQNQSILNMLVCLLLLMIQPLPYLLIQWVYAGLCCAFSYVLCSILHTMNLFSFRVILPWFNRLHGSAFGAIAKWSMCDFSAVLHLLTALFSGGMLIDYHHNMSLWQCWCMGALLMHSVTVLAKQLWGRYRDVCVKVGAYFTSVGGVFLLMLVVIAACMVSVTAMQYGMHQPDQHSPALQPARIPSPGVDSCNVGMHPYM